MGAPVCGGGTDPTGELPFVHLALDGGALFVCQTDGSVDAQWYVEKRLTSNLSLVPSFGTAGGLQGNPAAGGYGPPLGPLGTRGGVVLVGRGAPSSRPPWLGARAPGGGAA